MRYTIHSTLATPIPKHPQRGQRHTKHEEKKFFKIQTKIKKLKKNIDRSFLGIGDIRRLLPAFFLLFESARGPKFCYHTPQHRLQMEKKTKKKQKTNSATIPPSIACNKGFGFEV